MSPKSTANFMSAAFSLIESFFGGSAGAVIDKVDQIHTQEQNNQQQLKKVSQ